MRPGRTLTTYDELLAASGSDPFVRWEVAPDEVVTGWTLEAGVAFVRTNPSGRRSLALVTTPEVAVTALRTHLDASPADGDGLLAADAVSHGVTLPRGTLDLLGPEPRLTGGADWEWMWTAAPAPQHAAAADVVVLHDDTEISRLLESASPRHSSDPGDPDVVAWYGIRDAARLLVACVAHTEHVAGVPHLASIAVHPDVRGRGLGQAITGEVVRRGLAAGAEVVTLGMYSDNSVARRLYERLGFRCEHRWSSRRVTVVEPGGSPPTT